MDEEISHVEKKCPDCGRDMAHFMDVPKGESTHVCFYCKKAFKIEELIRQTEL